MVFNLATTRTSALLFSIIFLAACGGGGGDGNNEGNRSDGGGDLNTNSDARESDEPSLPSDIESDAIASEPIVSDLDTSIPDEPEDIQKDDDDSLKPAPVALDNDIKAGLVASNKVSLARTNCGLKGLLDDTDLGNVAIKHGNYIRHVYANSTPTSFNSHNENSISNIADVTGNNNPFFGGVSFAKRLSNANYSNVNYGVTENIAQTVYYSATDNIVTSEVAALFMIKSLLAAPYHLRSLMIPGASLTSSSMATYEPFNGLGYKNAKGYVLVNHAAVTAASKDDTVEGIFTYPCDGVTSTVTALYNESPNPFRNPSSGLPTRDLRTNPIGQPVYINMPSAQSIKVSNIKFRDVKRGVNVPVKLLDSNDDPYKGTNFELPANEAFIMPLTDSLKSCEAKRTQNQSQQCGLYGSSEYRVSFDVLVDNIDMQSKSFTFKTGKVSY